MSSEPAAAQTNVAISNTNRVTLPHFNIPVPSITQFDSLSDVIFLELLHKITTELRSVAQSYTDQISRLVAVPQQGANPQQERANFGELEKQKEKLIEEEEHKFGEFMPELREIYFALLKRRKEAFYGCNDKQLLLLICQDFGEFSDRSVADVANYLDRFADGLSK